MCREKELPRHNIDPISTAMGRVEKILIRSTDHFIGGQDVVFGNLVGGFETRELKSNARMRRPRLPQTDIRLFRKKNIF